MAAQLNTKTRGLVSVLITTKDRKEYVLECLASIQKSGCRNLEIIVVDNDSADGTPEAIRASFPEVKLLSPGKNLGIAGGRSLAENEARGEYLLFLDSDTVIHKEMVEKLRDVLDSRNDIGLTVPKMYFYDDPDRLWYAGSTFNLLTSKADNTGVREKDTGQYDRLKECAHGPTAFMVKTEVIEKLGGHDPLYFMSFADADLAMRIKEGGYKLLYVPEAMLWHRVAVRADNNLRGKFGFDSPLRAYYMARNRAIFMKKHAPLFNFLVFLVFFYPAFTIYYLVKIVQYNGPAEFMKNHLRGTWDGIKYALGLK